MDDAGGPRGRRVGAQLRAPRIAVATVTACAFLLSQLVPSGTRAVIAGLGVTIAFAGALYVGIIPTEPGR